jgi:Protein of unknown function (DUF1236)
MPRRINPQTHMQTMSRREERTGTRWMFAGAAVIALVVGVGLLAWFFVPGLGTSPGPKNAGVLSNQTVGASVASQQTKPLKTESPNSTGPYTVGRNEDIQQTAKPNLQSFSPAQLDAIQKYVAGHPQGAAQQVNFSIAVGAAVPMSAKLEDMPQQLAQAVPNYAGEQYLLVNNQFIIVEKQTRRIVAIVPVSNQKGANNG